MYAYDFTVAHLCKNKSLFSLCIIWNTYFPSADFAPPEKQITDDYWQRCQSTINTSSF